MQPPHRSLACLRSSRTWCSSCWGSGPRSGTCVLGSLPSSDSGTQRAHRSSQYPPLSSPRPNLPARTRPRSQPVSATVQPALDNKPQSVPASPRPQPVSATVQPAPGNKPQSAPASPRPQPVSVPVHPSPQSASNSQPQGVPASSWPQRVQPPAPI
ncbi:hypothetical protein E2C01_063538 [Portunus trituberculatus]|uniref:Uncharacterized protein n=1 Tax=Portunus trituberculatus TaxID=210409 RepID=A0A5B7HHB2_PORTR|nr:hypothetical protein [Portunus trituberculatus]